MTTCISCGNPIPDGQGRSCSMCYGDPDYGNDGYYRNWLEREDQKFDEKYRYGERWVDTEPPPHKDDF